MNNNNSTQNDSSLFNANEACNANVASTQDSYGGAIVQPLQTQSTSSHAEPEPILASIKKLSPDQLNYYNVSKECIEYLALYLRPINNGYITSPLSRPMQRKLVTLINCQLIESEGRIRALRAARSLGERTVTELILQHQNPQQLSANLWAAVRARGCQFLGPAMQEEVSTNLSTLYTVRLFMLMLMLIFCCCAK